MAQIVWRDRMSVGFKDIDDDHRKLIDIINDLDLVIAAPRFSADAVRATVARLDHWAQVHFEREERLMRLVGFPDLERHGGLHRAGLAALRQFTRNFAALPVRASAQDVHGFASTWLVKHVIMEDQAIAAHLPGGARR